MELILIRHSFSQHWSRGIIAGRSSCPGLTEQGVQQAHLLAQHLRTTGEVNKDSILLSSPVRRAYQTAEILATTLSIEAIVQDANLCEIDPGAAEGLSHEDYQSQYGRFDLPTYPTRPFAPGGETWLEFLARVGNTLDQIAKQYAGQSVVAVTHAGFIIASFLVLFDIPRPGTGTHLEPLPTSLTEWHFSSNRWSLIRFNEVCHDLLTRQR